MCRDRPPLLHSASLAPTSVYCMQSHSHVFIGCGQTANGQWHWLADSFIIINITITSTAFDRHDSCCSHAVQAGHQHDSDASEPDGGLDTSEGMESDAVADAARQQERRASHAQAGTTATQREETASQGTVYMFNSAAVHTHGPNYNKHQA